MIRQRFHLAAHQLSAAVELSPVPLPSFRFRFPTRTTPRATSGLVTLRFRFVLRPFSLRYQSPRAIAAFISSISLHIAAFELRSSILHTSILLCTATFISPFGVYLFDFASSWDALAPALYRLASPVPMPSHHWRLALCIFDFASTWVLLHPFLRLASSSPMLDHLWPFANYTFDFASSPFSPRRESRLSRLELYLGSCHLISLPCSATFSGIRFRSSTSPSTRQSTFRL